MIQMTSGVYGTKNGMKRASDGPFCLSAEEEARVVNRGVAKYVEGTAAPAVNPHDDDLHELPDGVTEIPEYNVEMSAKELREIGEMYGLSFPAVGMSKANMVKALDEHIAAHTVEGVTIHDDGKITVDDEDAPTFDPAGAVQ